MLIYNIFFNVYNNMKNSTKKYNQQTKKFKSVKIEPNKKKFISIPSLFPRTKKKVIFISFITLITIFIIIFIVFFFFSSENIINFDYSNYDRNRITDEMLQKSEWNLTTEEVYFINGVIRKFKPKKCLEIGVGKGGTSILILNAIKDIKGSFLISIDLNSKIPEDSSKKIGYRVSKYFPSLTQNWQLHTDVMPHKILDKINKKFNLAIIDTSHIMPGEILNIIEIMPFLEDNAILVFPNMISHLYNVYNKDMDKTLIKRTPTSIYLMASLIGKKKIIYDKNKKMGNIGLIILEKNQERFYENYFLLLMNIWEEMLSDEQIFMFRLFLEKYYKKEKYLNIFENAILYNKEYQKNFK